MRPAAASSQLSLDYEGVNHYWRPRVVMAQIFQRPNRHAEPLIAAVRCKKRKKGGATLQGVQLDMFESFYRPEVPVKVAADPNRPLADVFPEAYRE